MHLTISGLTAQQVKMCELLWGCETIEEVEALKAKHGVDAIIAHSMMVASVLDSVTDTELAYTVLTDILR